MQDLFSMFGVPPEVLETAGKFAAASQAAEPHLRDAAAALVRHADARMAVLRTELDVWEAVRAGVGAAEAVLGERASA